MMTTQNGPLLFHWQGADDVVADACYRALNEKIHRKAALITDAKLTKQEQNIIIKQKGECCENGMAEGIYSAAFA